MLVLTQPRILTLVIWLTGSDCYTFCTHRRNWLNIHKTHKASFNIGSCCLSRLKSLIIPSLGNRCSSTYLYICLLVFGARVQDRLKKAVYRNDFWNCGLFVLFFRCFLCILVPVWRVLPFGPSGALRTLACFPFQSWNSILTTICCRLE